MNVVIIGSGNVANALGTVLKKKYNIIQIISRNRVSGQELALRLNADFTNRIDDVKKKADIYILAIKDNEIFNVANKITDIDGLVVHTSGSVPVNVFSHAFKNYGVLYPVQTFSISNPIFLTNTPVAIEANTKQNEKKLYRFVSEVSKKVVFLNSEKRLSLHLAAVFANNFVNHLFTLSEKILKKQKINFNLLLPLINQTAANVINPGPILSQTGPARRNDTLTIKKHLQLLKKNKEMADLYLMLTKSIQKNYKK